MSAAWIATGIWRSELATAGILGLSLIDRVWDGFDTVVSFDEPVRIKTIAFTFANGMIHTQFLKEGNILVFQDWTPARIIKQDGG
jgi:hypothetical protein